MTSGEVHGFVCGPRLYEFGGWFFEVNAACGPWPLKKNGDPRARAGNKFWHVFADFDKLSKAKKNRYRVGGGCIRF
jgi:hypothetical protein